MGRALCKLQSAQKDPQNRDGKGGVDVQVEPFPGDLPLYLAALPTVLLH